MYRMCFSQVAGFARADMDSSELPLPKGGWLKNLRDIGDQSRELPRRMMLLRPRASFKSGQLRLRNLIPYYSHRGTFQEEPPPPSAPHTDPHPSTDKSSSPGYLSATFLEDPVLFIQKNSRPAGRDVSDKRRPGMLVEKDEEDEDSSCSSCEDKMELDSPVSLSDTFSSEIFLELARCCRREPGCDLNSNDVRGLSAAAAGECASPQPGVSEECVCRRSSLEDDILPSWDSSWCHQPAAER